MRKANGSMRSVRSGVAGVLIALLILAAGTAAVAFWAVSPVHAGAADKVTIDVKPGASVRQVADDLARHGLIRGTLPFRILARLRGASVKVGEYELTAGMSASAILGKLVRGEVITYPFTIPEGYTIRQIGDLLASKGFVERAEWDRLVYDDSATFDDYAFLPAKAPSPGKGAPKGFRVSRLEGFLFPDTYQYARGMTAEQIIRMLLNQFKAKFTAEMQQQAAARGMSIQQVVTLASIVEREAQVDAERPIIAGVFANRLRIGMRLESCATVNFLLERPRDILSLKDLETDSPYNTYRNGGLPPGPIANPGLASLQAALAPADTDYLFFASKFDGTHAFAKTLAEHNRNVAMFETWRK
ncbi:MAG: endolytic transglycosylase MltG [Chloroflexota bacterium]